MSHSLGDERAGAGVVAAVTGVDIVEDLASFGGLDATLEHAGDTALVELAVDDGVGLASMSDHPSFRLVCRQGAGFQVGDVGLGPVVWLIDECDQGCLWLERDSDVDLPRGRD